MYENWNKQQKINCKKFLSKKDSDYFFTGVYIYHGTEWKFVLGFSYAGYQIDEISTLTGVAC